MSQQLLFADSIVFTDDYKSGYELTDLAGGNVASKKTIIDVRQEVNELTQVTPLITVG